MSTLDHLSVPEMAPTAPNREATATSSGNRPTAPPVRRLTLDFLAWVAARPRSYAEAMEAWRTSCPRFTIWEDALADDLIRLEEGHGTTMDQTVVTLTQRGRAVLDGA
jgi:hypothetical protein